MKKLDMKICRCGRIHFYSTELLSSLLEEDKELVLICSKCGTVTHIGADKEPMCFYNKSAAPGEIVFNMYSYDQDEETITADNFDTKKMTAEGKRTIGQVIVDPGIGVMMETGHYASSYFNGFEDLDSWFDIRTYTTMEELLKDKEEFDKKRSMVRMRELIRNLTDEQADVLSGYLIDGLDWEGTKWEKPWHKK